MNNRLDQAINEIQNEQPSPAVVAQAGENVRRNLFGAGAAGTGELKTCDDFRSLFAAYLQKSLSDARRMLVEDHIHACPACRKQMDRLRSGGSVSGGTVRPMPLTKTRQRPVETRWAIAAGVVAAAGLSLFAASRFMPAAFHTGAQASITTVDGMLYRVANDTSLPIGSGQEIDANQPVRTPAGSRAMLTLWDGSRVEMNERSQVAVSTGWKGTTIRLDRGHIIVQAAKQKQGHLIVASGDARVLVKGTVFSVNKGTLGSRVSVVEGNVEVAQYGRTEDLKPGDQTTTSPMVGKIPVEAEVAWSKEAARYVALLGEFQALQKGWEAIPAQGLRHQSRLLVLLPEDTRILASLPNMGVTLVEAKRIFDERLQASPTLREWWMEPSRASMRTEVDRVMVLLKDLSAMVGDEILIGIRDTGNGKERVVMLAEAKSADVQAKLTALIQSHGGKPNEMPFTVKDNVLILSDSAAGVAEVEAILTRGGSPSSPFRQRVERAYRDGAGWLFAADLEKLGAGREMGGKDAGTLGLDALEYIVAERREIGGRVENSATVSFKGERRGIPAWLGSPSAISTLSFVSPDASGAVSFVVKEPRAIVEEMFALARKQGSNFDRNLAEIEQELGIRILDDVAASLGVEMTVAIDGPLLPVPSWKIATEVHAPQRLLASIEKMVEAFNRHAGQTPKLVLTKEQVSGRQFVKITGGRLPTEVHFTFVDSYLLAAPDRTLLTQAMQNRQTGFTLPQSEKFRAQLPFGGEPNFSGVVYHNIGGAVSTLADTFGSLIDLSPAQQESVNMLKDSKPGVITLRAEQDRIRIGTTGAFAGLNLGMLTNQGGLFSVLSRQQ